MKALFVLLVLIGSLNVFALAEVMDENPVVGERVEQTGGEDCTESNGVDYLAASEGEQDQSSQAGAVSNN